MSTESHAVVVFEARDMASARTRELGKEIGFLENQVKRTALSFFRFTSILGATGLSVYSLVNIVKSQIANMEATTRAATTFTSQLRFLGFSAEDAAGSVGTLRNALNSTAFQALPGLDAPLKTFLAQLGPDTLTRIDDLSKKLSLTFGVDQKTAITAITEALAGNIEPLSKITGSTADAVTQFDLLEKAAQEVFESLDPLQRLTLPGQAWKEWMEPFWKLRDKLREIDWPTVWKDFYDPEAMKALGLDTAKSIIAGLNSGKDFFNAAFRVFFTEQIPGLGVWLWEQAQGFGGAIISGIWTGMDSMKDFFATNFKSFFTEKIPDFLAFLFDKGRDLGESLAVGIWAGIDSLSSSIWAKAWAFAVGIWNSVKGGLGALWPFSSAAPTSPLPGTPFSPVPPASTFPSPASPTPSATRGMELVGGVGSQTLNVTLQVDRDKLGNVIMDVVNGQVRLLEPNVGLR